MIEKFKDKTPRPQRGKTAKDTRLVRFVDLNHTIEEINTEISTEVESLQTQIDNIPSGGSEYTETIVNITSDDINGSSNYIIKELLPDITPNYYEGEVRLEFTPGATPFTVGGGYILVINGNGENAPTINANFLTSLNASKITLPFTTSVPSAVFDPPAVDGNVYTMEENSYTALYLYAIQADISLGNGIIRAVVRHKTITFGA